MEWFGKCSMKYLEKTAELFKKKLTNYHEKKHIKKQTKKESHKPEKMMTKSYKKYLEIQKDLENHCKNIL